MNLHACSIINRKDGLATTLGHQITFIPAATPAEALASALRFCGEHFPNQSCQVVVAEVPKPALLIRDTTPMIGEYISVN